MRAASTTAIVHADPDRDVLGPFFAYSANTSK
jgi:hypothetical protein